MNILIVDDIPVNLRLLRAMLEGEGHSVFEAVDGVEALAVLERRKIDAVISDVLMPRMDGYRLCYEIRASEKFGGLPIIIYTSSYTSEADEKLSLDLGADKFLRKPAPLPAILDALHVATSQARTRQSRGVLASHEADVLKEYSERLVAKLEQKNHELQNSTEELRVTHEELRELLARTPAVIYKLKVEGRNVVPVLVSDNVRQLLGIAPSECGDHTWWRERVHPDDRDSADATFTKALKEGGYSIEYRVRRQDGTYRWVEDTARFIPDAEGNPAEMIGVWTDITERKRAEEVMRGASSNEVGRRNKRILVDMAVIAVLSVFAFALGACFDIYDPIFHYLAWADDRAVLYLNDIVATLVFLCFALSVFSFRRWSESRAEILSQAQMTEAMRVLHGELEMRVQQRTMELSKANDNLRAEVAERRRAEEAVKRLAAIVESSDDAIASKTLDGTITSWNPAAERMLGYSVAEIVGHPVTILFPPDRLKEEKDILARLRKGEHVHHYETVRVRKDGTLVDVSATISPIRDAEGNLVGASKILRDITERRKDQRQINLLHTCVSNLNDIVLVAEAEPLNEPGPRIVFVNDAMQRLTGYTRAETLGRSPRFLQGPKTDLAVLAEIQEALKQRKPIRRQLVNYRKDGSEYSVEIDIVPIFDANGRCTHFVAIERDVTERNQAEEQIAEQADLLDKTQDAILVRDLKGGIVFWNKGAERMYGWTRQEAQGRNVAELLYTDTKKFEEANRVTQEKGEWSGELRHLAKDRHELMVEARWTLVTDKEGRPKSVLAINTDVTEKKKIEAQFMRAQRMESIGILAGGVAHDLNNILAPIMMSIDVLKCMDDSGQNREILETIETSAKRGADIVRQVLSFARGVEGERVEIQAKHLLRDLQRIIKDTFPKNIRLQFSIPHDIRTILGDPTQMHQVLLNLCVNARDAMPDGGELAIKVENREIDDHYAGMNPQAKAGAYVVISVADSGTGIPQDILDKIFEPFFTTKEVGKGTGLGLSTVMAIVKSHEGFIDVSSEPDRGTTFSVYLPASTASEGDAKRDEDADMPRGNGEVVLVIDDEASILTITGQTLQAFGYRVLTASDGADAVAVFARHRDEVAVVLTDMMMPVMDGTATIHALTRIKPTIKIIAASGLNSAGGITKATAAGIKHFLTKPYTAGSLLRTLREILEEG